MDLSALFNRDPHTNIGHDAFQTALSNYMNTQQAAYAGPKMQADIASKAAYATYTPYSYLTKALSDPMTFYALSQNPEQMKAVVSKLSNMPTNPMQSLYGNRQTQENELGTHSNGLWNWAKGLFQGGDQNIPQQSPQQMPQQAPQQEFGEANKASPEMVDYIAKNGNNAFNAKQPQQPQQPSGSLSNQDMLNSIIAAKYPNSPQALALQSKQKQDIAEGQATAKVKANTMQKVIDDANNDAKSAYSLSLEANKFHEAYKDAIIKGRIAQIPGGKTLAKLDSDSYKAMNAANNMAVSLASQLFGNRQSDYREQLAQTLKLGIDTPEKAEQTIFNGIQAMSARAQQHPEFYEYAKEKGITDPNKLTNLWFRYNRDKPFYDVKTKQVNEDNLKAETYQNFIDKNISGSSRDQKVSNTSSNSSPVWPSGKEPRNANDDSVRGQLPPPGTVWMVTPKGDQVPVAKENIDYAKKEYNFRGIND